MNNSSANKPDRDAIRWYVVRCHNRSLRRVRALFDAKEIVYYVPETYKIVEEKGKKVKKLFPVFSDIIFVKSSYNEIKRLKDVEKYPIIFYFSHTSHIQDDAIWVKDKEMELFIKASYMYDRSPEIKYFGEVKFKPGDRIRVVDGSFIGAEGYLVQIRRGQKKQLLFTLSNMITVNLSIDEQDLIEKIED